MPRVDIPRIAASAILAFIPLFPCFVSEGGGRMAASWRVLTRRSLLRSNIRRAGTVPIQVICGSSSHEDVMWATLAHCLIFIL